MRTGVLESRKTLSHADWRTGEQEEEWEVFAFDLYGQFARAWLSHGT